MNTTRWLLLLVTGLMLLPAPARAQDEPAKKKKKPSNLDLFLGDPEEKPTKPANPLDGGSNPFRNKNAFRRTDALPGVVELNDGRQMPGGLYTTREKDFEVHIEAEKRWRRVPFVIVLSIEPVLLEEKMEQHWRWKAMGVPERVYTGKEYPYRRFRWKFNLIDGTSLTGVVKGQPLWIEKLPTLGHEAGRYGPFVFHERFSGPEGTKLKDHPYMKRIIISRRMMDKVVTHQKDKADEVVQGNPATEAPTKWDAAWGKKPGQTPPKTPPPNKPNPIP